MLKTTRQDNKRLYFSIPNCLFVTENQLKEIKINKLGAKSTTYLSTSIKVNTSRSDFFSLRWLCMIKHSHLKWCAFILTPLQSALVVVVVAVKCAWRLDGSVVRIKQTLTVNTDQRRGGKYSYFQCFNQNHLFINVIKLRIFEWSIGHCCRTNRLIS